ncbi:conserved hypothetical protein [Histoplasma mississippiense (nom. inval.)]|uniref:conserved hypothetical protein n=1 Tax=Ajellomyces capsulatus (strain NAm1 / WU24) TaxID=2059318 RepID=UPI000157B8B6|nr:conserved hypothetical protein [Histoplasma mississippiense (nom. inval.)]EDN03538.1 conserved hypothetical protein [Histoplasma mississippiense (nom. inval.)]
MVALLGRDISLGLPGVAMKEEERESVPIKTCKIAFEAFKGINGKMCGRPIVKGKKCHGGKLKERQTKRNTGQHAHYMKYSCIPFEARCATEISFNSANSNSINYWIIEKITRLVQSLRAKSLLLPYPGDPTTPHVSPTAQSPAYSNLDAVDIAHGKARTRTSSFSFTSLLISSSYPVPAYPVARCAFAVAQKTMSPPAPAIAPSAGSAAKDVQRESAMARLLGSGSSGIAELLIFHPIASVSQLNKVVFKDFADASIAKKFTSLFPGLGYAAGYKVLQRIYKYGGQPFVRDYLAKNHGSSFDNAFGKGTGKAIMHATAGRNFENPESGFRIVSSMIRNEGPTSFFKGLTPKLLMTGPKLVFSFWLAQTLIPAFGKVV